MSCYHFVHPLSSAARWISSIIPVTLLLLFPGYSDFGVHTSELVLSSDESPGVPLPSECCSPLATTRQLFDLSKNPRHAPRCTQAKNK